jgi:hypothetical protein
MQKPIEALLPAYFGDSIGAILEHTPPISPQIAAYKKTGNSLPTQNKQNDETASVTLLISKTFLAVSAR